MSQVGQTPRSRPRTPWINGVVLALLVVAFLALFTLRGGRTVDPEQNPAVGSRLAALDLLPLTGDSMSVTLDDLRGKVALVNFWATWCGPCQTELPELAELARSMAGYPDFRILAVSCGEEDPDSLRANTEATLRDLDVDLPTYADPGGVTRDAYDRVGQFQGFPTTFLLDRDGVIRAVWVGYLPGTVDEMETEAKRLLE